MTQPAMWPASQSLPALSPGDSVFLVGIGGAGMSGLARALKELGLAPQGSDRQASEATRSLEAEGIQVHIGHSASNISAECKLLVHTPAVGAENIELQTAQLQGIPITKRFAILGGLMDARNAIAIAGTHGKTTTSGLLAACLDASGQMPGFFIGAQLPYFGTNARLGTGPLVIEADEYDRSFLNGHPKIGVITNLEHDHPDIYPSVESLLEAFAAFAGRVQDKLIVNAAWPLAIEALSDLASQSDTESVSIEFYWVEGDRKVAQDSSGIIKLGDLRWKAMDIVSDSTSQSFEVLRDGESLGRFDLALPGRHNVGNTLAVIASMDALGLSLDALRMVFRSYQGAGRRYQELTRIDGITLVDDYAHHPTEIEATIQAARSRLEASDSLGSDPSDEITSAANQETDRHQGRVLCVVEPHTYSRVQLLGEDFAEAIDRADRAWVAPVYAAREAMPEGVDLLAFVDGLEHAERSPSLEAAAESIADEARAGDILLFMGAGNIEAATRHCASSLRAGLRERMLRAAQDRKLGGAILVDEPLSKHTSMRVGGPAAMAVRVKQIEDLKRWWMLAHELDCPVRVIGRGSNIIVTDAGADGLILLNRCEAWTLEGDSAHSDRTDMTSESSSDQDSLSLSNGILVDSKISALCESGVTLAALGSSLARQGYYGIENGVGIPGSVGAGVVTNAGAHGWEMADSVIDVEVLDSSGHTRWMSADDLAFRYRGTCLKGALDRLVLRVRLRLGRDERSSILERIDRYQTHRRETQPREPSVGSVFKNPEGDYAGRQIESLGMKGHHIGDAFVSETHANFIINRAAARAEDVIALIQELRVKVEHELGSELETEIEIVERNLHNRTFRPHRTNDHV